MAIDNKDKKVLKSSIEREQNEVACSAECEKIKGSKNLNVPPLRFPEFTEEWKAEQLDNIATLSKGIGISKEQLSEDGEPCILYGELYTKYKSEIIKQVESKTDIDGSKLKRSKANDVIIPCSGETAVDIATARCVPFDSILLGGDLNVISLHKYDGAFMSYQLNGKRKYDIARVAQGVSVVHLYGEHLKTIKTYNPTLPEQQKIAILLSLLDERIATQNKIIEDLKKLKCAIIEKVLNGNNANNLRLGDVGSYIRGLTYSSDDVVEYNSTLVMRSNNIVNGSLLDYQNNVVSVNKQISQEQQLQDGDIIICMANGSSALVGKSSFYDGKCISPITVGAFCGIYRSKTAITKWLFQTNRYRRYIWNSLQGGNGAIANLNSEDILRMSFPLPDKQTAERCIKLLSSLESLIESNISLYSKFFQQKEYLLRQMFI